MSSCEKGGVVMKQCACCGKVYKGIPDAADLFQDSTLKDSPTNGYYWECEGQDEYGLRCNSTLFIPERKLKE